MFVLICLSATRVENKLQNKYAALWIYSYPLLVYRQTVTELVKQRLRA